MKKFSKALILMALLGLLTSFAYAGPDDTARPLSNPIEMSILE